MLIRKRTTRPRVVQKLPFDLAHALTLTLTLAFTLALAHVHSHSHVRLYFQLHSHFQVPQN